MKKKILLLIIICGCLLTTGCFKRDNFEDVTIYTTVYPVEYLTSQLYGYNSDVKSIYPAGGDIDTYELTDKRIKEYSSAEVFVYNGLSNEKEIARSFINENEDLKIIDVSYGLKYTYGVEELWLSPNNYLMLANNVKNSLEELISSKYIKEEINANFDILEEEISLMDAELRTVGSAALSDNKNSILSSCDLFKFLENYDFDVTILKSSEDMNSTLKNQLKNGTFKYILVKDDEEINDYLKEIIKNNNLETVSIDTMTVLNDEHKKANDTYLTIMKEFLEQIKNVTIGK